MPVCCLLCAVCYVRCEAALLCLCCGLCSALCAFSLLSMPGAAWGRGVPRCLCAMCKLYALCYVCVLLCVLCMMSRRGWSVCACCSLCCVLGAFLQSACNVLRKRGFASLRMRHAVCRGLHPSLTPQSISSPHSRWPTHKHTDHGAVPTHTAHSMQTS